MGILNRSSQVTPKVVLLPKRGDTNNLGYIPNISDVTELGNIKKKW